MKKIIISIIVTLSLLISTQTSLNYSHKDSFAYAEEKLSSEILVDAKIDHINSNEIKFREEFGLDVSKSTILFATENYKIGKYGVHLSEEEELSIYQESFISRRY